MSFEEDRVQVFKDPRWSKPSRGLIVGVSTLDLGHRIEAALTGACRDKKMKGLIDATRLFKAGV